MLLCLTADILLRWGPHTISLVTGDGKVGRQPGSGQGWTQAMMGHWWQAKPATQPLPWFTLRIIRLAS